jgi:hypothetical protein
MVKRHGLRGGNYRWAPDAMSIQNPKRYPGCACMANKTLIPEEPVRRVHKSPVDRGAQLFIIPADATVKAQTCAAQTR